MGRVRLDQVRAHPFPRRLPKPTDEPPAAKPLAHRTDVGQSPCQVRHVVLRPACGVSRTLAVLRHERTLLLGRPREGFRKTGSCTRANPLFAQRVRCFRDGYTAGSCAVASVYRGRPPRPCRRSTPRPVSRATSEPTLGRFVMGRSATASVKISPVVRARPSANTASIALRSVGYAPTRRARRVDGGDDGATVALPTSASTSSSR